LPMYEAVLSNPEFDRDSSVLFSTFNPKGGPAVAECGGVTGESYFWGLEFSGCGGKWSGENPDNAGLKSTDESDPAKKKSTPIGTGISTDPLVTPGAVFVTSTGESYLESPWAGDADSTGGILVPHRNSLSGDSAGRMIYWYEGEY